MTDEELCCATEHQVERLFGTCTEVFACYSYHYVSVLCDEADQALEASYAAGAAFY